MPNRGDAVILRLHGKDFNALVLAESNGGSDYLGKNGEPALHLAYVPDELIDSSTRKPKVRQIGYIPEAQIAYGVVHVSHAFDADYMRQHNLRKVDANDPNRIIAEAELRNRRGAGEWREVPRAVAVESEAKE
jgi:hypothetical protein